MNVLQRLNDAGAVLLDQHFVYVSGKHGSGYINMDNVFPDADLMSSLCGGLIDPFLDDVDTIAAPAVGGVVLSVLASRAALDKGRDVRAVWADKKADGGFVFERAGFVELIRGKRVLVVEDLLNTGGSVERVSRAVQDLGADLVGVSVICNRGGVTAAQLGAPRLEALANVKFDAVEPDSCELCAGGVPIVDDIGHGDKYKADNPGYPGGFVSLLAT